jgi:hypothetical protein
MGWMTEGSEFESQWGQKFSLLHVVQTGSGAHRISYPMGTGGSFFLGVKQQGHEAKMFKSAKISIFISFSIACLLMYNIYEKLKNSLCSNVDHIKISYLKLKLSSLRSVFSDYAFSSAMQCYLCVCNKFVYAVKEQ